MSYLVFSVFVCLLCAHLPTTKSEHSVPYKVGYIDQYVDHFNFARFGNQTFKERYLIQDKWWDKKNNGPIFFYTGNEGPIEAFWKASGLMFDLAPRFGALILFGEHRYYGKSLPFGPSKSFQRPYIGLLTMRQALADFAYLINSIKKQHGAEKSPVIAFGGSYGGMLAAYFRMKHPSVCDGSIAASAPIYLLNPKFDHSFFFTDVTKDFSESVSGCVPRIKRAFTKMDQLMTEGKKGLAMLTKYFQLCQPLTGKAAYTHLLGWIRNAFTNTAMFDYPYATNFLPVGNPVKFSCDHVLSAADDISGLAAASGIYYNATFGPLKCFDISKEYVSCADPTGCGIGPNAWAWDYQACTDILLPPGSNNVTDMFPILPFNDTLRNEYCMKTWGTKPNPDWAYWGQDLRTTSNIVFSNGNLDPWHRGGVLKDVSKSVRAFMVIGGAHHLDLRGHNSKDPVSVIKVRGQEAKMIEEWVMKAKKSRQSIST